MGVVVSRPILLHDSTTEPQPYPVPTSRPMPVKVGDRDRFGTSEGPENPIVETLPALI